MQNRLVFIGGGNMAEAIFSKLKDLSLDIFATQRNPEKRARLTREHPKLSVMPDLNFNTIDTDIVILAVKPQDAKETCLHLKDKLKNSTIVSIMASINSNTLSSWLDNNKIVRAMPNTPASVGYGVSGIYFTQAVQLEQKRIIEEIFAATGTIYTFQDESYIEKITPVSGSAPAYVFYFIESLISAAIDKFGFDEKTAKEITLQVIKGSIAMIENNSNVKISQLRANVTSKKGTTEQAIQTFEKYNLPQIICEAEVACYNRAIEMAKLFT